MTYVFLGDLTEQPFQRIPRFHQLFDGRFAVAGQPGQGQHRVRPYGGVRMVPQRHNGLDGPALVQADRVRWFGRQFRHILHERQLTLRVVFKSYFAPHTPAK